MSPEASTKGNICILAWRDLWHPEAGGAERYITSLSEALVARGYSVTILTGRYPQAATDQKHNGVTYIRRGGRYSIYLKLPLYYLFKLKESTNLLIESFNAFPFWIPLYERKRLAIIYHLQSVEWAAEIGRLLGGLMKQFLSVFFPFIYRKTPIITISTSSQKSILHAGFHPSFIEIVPPGTDLPISTDITKPNDTVNLFSVGRIKKTKHIDKALHLIRHTLDQKPTTNIHLNIAGKGDYLEPLKELVQKLSLEKYVTFLGYISEEEKIEYLKKSHLHIQFSTLEGWGITTIEAATQATPTVCLDVPGLRDSVTPNTGYIAKEDGSNLSEVWLQSIEDARTQNETYRSKQTFGLTWASKFTTPYQTTRLCDIISEHFFAPEHTGLP